MATLQTASELVALDKDLTLSAHRVLRYIEARLSYENAIPLIQSEVAAGMAMNKAQVGRAFRMLLAKGIIEQIKSPALKPVYRLNLNYGWRGKHEKWSEARKGAGALTLVRGGRE